MIFLLAFFSFILACSVSAHDLTEQTFFMPRSTALDVIQQNSLSQYRIDHSYLFLKDYRKPVREVAHNCQVSVFYQASANQCDLTEYFSICHKKRLIVDEQGFGDIGSGWLGLFGQNENFLGSFTFRPERRVVGAILQYHHDFSEAVSNAWLEINLPFVSVSHDLNFCEDVETDNLLPGSFESISCALNNPAWCYGKWSPCSRSKCGVDDMLVKLGWRFVKGKRVNSDLYATFLVPLAGSPDSEFIFEPVIGSGGGFVLGAGGMFNGMLYEGEKSDVSWITDFQYRYLFSHEQIRSFDLKGKPWSRYMLYNRDDGTILQVVPGINFLTQPVSVRPGNSVDLNTYFHFRYSSFNAELGYRFWWRESEKVRLLNCCIPEMNISAQANDLFLPDAVISDPWGLPEDGAGEFTALTSDDFDLASAAHKTAQSHTVYGAVSLMDHVFEHPYMIGVGGSYEFAERNTAFDGWSIWGRISLGF